MADVYVVVHIATTFGEAAAYVPKDAVELVALSWCTVDSKTLQPLPRTTILVRPTNTPVTAEFLARYLLSWDDIKEGKSFKDAILEFDAEVSKVGKNKTLCFVSTDLHTLRVLLPREARDKSVVLPAYLQHPRVFDLFNEYLKWQAAHPEAMSYPSSCLTNLVTALGVSVPETWSEATADDTAVAADVYAQILVQLAKKSVPLDAHQNVLTKPYDTALDARVFLAERSKTLYLTNLPPDTTQLELESWFAQYGGRPIAFWTLKNVDPDTKNQGTKSRGISGFAVFAKHEDAAESLYLNGRLLMDRVIEVQASSTRVLDRASELLTPFPPLKNRPRPGDWTCPSCGFSNFQRRIACFRCSFPATSAVTIQDQIYTGPNSNNGSHEGLNNGGAVRRQKSDEKQGLSPYGGYQDQFQGQHHGVKSNNSYHYNQGYTNNHNMANQRQTYGNTVPFRAGDWKCPNDSCQYHNFAKNLCCLKCGAAKPASAGSQMHGSHGMNVSTSNNGSMHGNSAAAAAAAAAVGSIHTVNTTAAAIAAATASGQPLNLSNNFLNIQQPQPHYSRGTTAMQSSSSSPIHSGGLYSNISQLQQLQYQQGKLQGQSHMPQHLALLQGQGQLPNSAQRQRGSQSASSSPGMYVGGHGHSYKGREDGSTGSSGINSLSSQINAMSLNNGG